MCDFMLDGSNNIKDTKRNTLSYTLKQAEDALSAVATVISGLSSEDVQKESKILIDIFNDSIGICQLLSEKLLPSKKELEELTACLSRIGNTINKN